MTRTVAHLPRPARLATAVLARWRPAGIPPAIVTAVLRGHGLTPTAEARNLDLSRRSHNVVVATDDGPVVVKQYRSDWTPGRVEHVHAVLGHLQDVGSPVPRLRRRTDGATVTTLGGRTFAVMDLVEGRNVSLDWMTRADRLRAAMVAGRVLARLHHDLTGFEPAGDHHLGFTSLQGPPRRPLGWYLDRLHVLSGAAVTDAHGPDAAPVDLPALARLAARGGELADRLASLDRQVQGADLPRLVIHGDFGLHNLVFTSPLRAVAVDFELARIDWRLTDLVLAVGRFGRTRTSWNPSDVAAFLAAYTRWQPLLRDELAMLGNVWATVRLCSAVRAWDTYARTGVTHHLHAAQNAIGEVDWLDRNPARLQRLAAMATVARPPVGRPGAGRPEAASTPSPAGREASRA